jgi:hypothetical protein
LDFSELGDESLTFLQPDSGDEGSGGFTAAFRPTSSSIAKGILFLSLHLSGTILLLIQGSLALAFGLAALVAAVRFRVVLEEAIDGIFVFAAICVGLSAGVGYLGIAAVMTVFFCFTILILWQLEFGENPLDEARQEKKRAKVS